VVHVKTAATHHVTPSGLGDVIDQARLVEFPKPVKTVFVGNPTVVDVSMIDSQHAFLLGKTFGVTNMIALAADGNQISNQQVTAVNNGAAVTINRGADQFNYMCTHAHCETAPRPGDPNAYVANTEGVATGHASTANAAGANVQAQQAAN
jgi:Flp pilus assembly secretin CpaC